MDIRWEGIKFVEVIARGYNPISGDRFEESDLLRASDIVGRLEELVRELKKDYEIIKNATPQMITLPEIAEPITTELSSKDTEPTASPTPEITASQKPPKKPIEPRLDFKLLQDKLQDLLYASTLLSTIFKAQQDKYAEFDFRRFAKTYNCSYTEISKTRKKLENAGVLRKVGREIKISSSYIIYE